MVNISINQAKSLYLDECGCDDNELYDALKRTPKTRKFKNHAKIKKQRTITN